MVKCLVICVQHCTSLKNNSGVFRSLYERFVVFFSVYKSLDYYWTHVTYSTENDVLTFGPLIGKFADFNMSLYIRPRVTLFYGIIYIIRRQKNDFVVITIVFSRWIVGRHGRPAGRADLMDCSCHNNIITVACCLTARFRLILRSN